MHLLPECTPALADNLSEIGERSLFDMSFFLFNTFFAMCDVLLTQSTNQPITLLNQPITRPHQCPTDLTVK